MHVCVFSPHCTRARTSCCTHRHTMQSLLPTALGFACGCMVWIVASELLPDALEDAPPRHVATAVTLSAAALEGVRMGLNTLQQPDGSLRWPVNAPPSVLLPLLLLGVLAVAIAAAAGAHRRCAHVYFSSTTRDNTPCITTHRLQRCEHPTAACEHGASAGRHARRRWRARHAARAASRPTLPPPHAAPGCGRCNWLRAGMAAQSAWHGCGGGRVTGGLAAGGWGVFVADMGQGAHLAAQRRHAHQRQRRGAPRAPPFQVRACIV